jgi:glycosyltransferase involved in cell wall biosynthesis
MNRMVDKRLKIFVDAHCFDGEYQGSRTFVKEIYTAMAAKKDVVLYIAACNVDQLKAHFPKGENIVFVKYRSRSSFVRLIYDIPWLIKKHGIDVAHFQYITPLFKNCRQVVTIHDVIFNDYPEEFSTAYRLLKKYLYKRSTRTADVVTTVSSFSKASIQKHLATNGHPVYVIPNGINPVFFNAYQKDQAKLFFKKKYGFDKFILYVSRLEPRKNHLSLLNACLDVKAFEKGYKLVFIGHETLPVTELKERLDAMKPDAKSSVFFGTGICDEDLLQFYRAASVFIYPSKAEGFGIPPLEAGAVGVPVVCSNTSAMQDFSFFGDCHIDATEYECLKNKLCEVLAQEPDKQKLAKISETIKANYSWVHSAEKLYDLIKAN